MGSILSGETALSPHWPAGHRTRRVQRRSDWSASHQEATPPPGTSRPIALKCERSELAAAVRETLALRPVPKRLDEHDWPGVTSVTPGQPDGGAKTRECDEEENIRESLRHASNSD